MYSCRSVSCEAISPLYWIWPNEFKISKLNCDRQYINKTDFKCYFLDECIGYYYPTLFVSILDKLLQIMFLHINLIIPHEISNDWNWMIICARDVFNDMVSKYWWNTVQ
jgi:hypothetical protein